MSRYADMEWLKDHIEVISYEGMWHETETDEFVSVENINSAPTIEIIRCKECKHWHKKDDLTYCDRIDYGYGYKADDFCSYGYRTTNAVVEEKPTPIRDYMVCGVRNSSEKPNNSERSE